MKLQLIFRIIILSCSSLSFTNSLLANLPAPELDDITKLRAQDVSDPKQRLFLAAHQGDMDIITEAFSPNNISRVSTNDINTAFWFAIAAPHFDAAYCILSSSSAKYISAENLALALPLFAEQQDTDSINKLLLLQKAQKISLRVLLDTRERAERMKQANIVKLLDAYIHRYDALFEDIESNLADSSCAYSRRIADFNNRKKILSFYERTKDQNHYPDFQSFLTIGLLAAAYNYNAIFFNTVTEASCEIENDDFKVVIQTLQRRLALKK